ncbi:hypothetical protein [Pedobacter caeni]|uniref:Uncharacterized protein n=1 Tax=Pedobacter caeni TaxID=288992 RepID=A0A1M5NFZ1_9SPHI|nr:hypothetical protein [Pedobacter caeni]SHG88431.1 hypothetical protein SAMN04488522_108128 [Pedobacter caeni]
MKTIDDLQLENELQELYLVTKYWISGLEFCKGELSFFRKLSSGYISNIKGKIGNLHLLLQKTEILEQRIKEVSVNIHAHLKFLEPLVLGSTQNITILLLNKHLNMEKEINTLFEDFQSVKQGILGPSDPLIFTQAH